MQRRSASRPARHVFTSTFQARHDAALKTWRSGPKQPWSSGASITRLPWRTTAHSRLAPMSRERRRSAGAGDARRPHDRRSFFQSGTPRRHAVLGLAGYVVRRNSTHVRPAPRMSLSNSGMPAGLRWTVGLFLKAVYRSPGVLAGSQNNPKPRWTESTAHAGHRSRAWLLDGRAQCSEAPGPGRVLRSRGKLGSPFDVQVRFRHPSVGRWSLANPSGVLPAGTIPLRFGSSAAVWAPVRPVLSLKSDARSAECASALWFVTIRSR